MDLGGCLYARNSCWFPMKQSCLQTGWKSG